MNIEGIVAAIAPVVAVFEQLEIEYYIGGSVGSSTYGIPRATFDVDLIADLRQEHVRYFTLQIFWIEHSWMPDSRRANKTQ